MITGSLNKSPQQTHTIFTRSLPSWCPTSSSRSNTACRCLRHHNRQPGPRDSPYPPCPYTRCWTDNADAFRSMEYMCFVGWVGRILPIRCYCRYVLCLFETQKRRLILALLWERGQRADWNVLQALRTACSATNELLDLHSGSSCDFLPIRHGHVASQRGNTLRDKHTW